MLLVHEYNTPGSQTYILPLYTHASVVETYLVVSEVRGRIAGCRAEEEEERKAFGESH